MNNLAQNISVPGFGRISGDPNFKSTDFTNLGSLLTNSLNLIFMLVTFLAFIYLIWGAVSYIFAGGDKQQLGAARQRLTYALVGLFVVALAFAASQFIEQILTPARPSPISPTSFELVTPVYAAKVDLGQNYDFGNYQSLGDLLSKVLPTVFSIAAVGVLFYLVIGGFKYLISGGNKESVSSAREMITHSIIGLLILLMVFLVMQFIPQFFGFEFSIF